MVSTFRKSMLKVYILIMSEIAAIPHEQERSHVIVFDRSFADKNNFSLIYFFLASSLFSCLNAHHIFFFSLKFKHFIKIVWFEDELLITWFCPLELGYTLPSLTIWWYRCASTNLFHWHLWKKIKHKTLLALTLCGLYSLLVYFHEFVLAYAQ